MKPPKITSSSTRKRVGWLEGLRLLAQLVLLDEIATAPCGIEHPRLGNACILEENHIPETHEDAAGNEWIGRPE